MSRAVAATQQKANQKAAIAEKNQERDLQKSLGLTATNKAQIKADTLICLVCGATKMGPTTSCQCTGGRTPPKPGSDNLDPENLPHLVAAWKSRQSQQKASMQQENLRKQNEVSGQRGKKRMEAALGEGGKGNAELEVQAIDGVEMEQVVEFPIGKLGMDISNNGIVMKVNDASSGPAGDLGVKPGWYIIQVNNESVPPKKTFIVKAITTVFKSNKPCAIKFRVPVTEGEHWYCYKCDKFIEVGKFSSEGKGAEEFGKKMCEECEEFADMF